MSFDACEQSERTLLGTCLQEDDLALDFVTSAVSPEDFYLDSHRRIFTCVSRMYAARIPVNTSTVPQELGRELEFVGGWAYISSLTEGLPYRSLESAQNHAERVREFSRKRRLAVLATEMARQAADATSDSVSIVSSLQTSLEGIVGDSATDRPEVEAYTVSALDQWEIEREHKQSPGLNYGIPLLDQVTGGMMPGEQTALGASSGVGKTSFLVQVLFENCSRGIPCHAFLLEPTRRQVLSKMWSMLSGVRYGAVTKPWTANLSEAEAIRNAARQMVDWPLRLHDRSTLTLDQMLGLARLSINRHGTRLIALDYVQRLKIKQAEKDEPVRLRVARASTALADLVKGTRCSSLLLSQLTTGRKNGAQAKPTMYDFRESSQIENDAHTIILLHRNYDEDQGHYTSEGAIFVPKQRFGSPCNLAAAFDGKMAVWR